MLDFFLKPKNAFGLDISAGSFKIAQLEREGADYEIKSYSHTVFPKALMLNDAISDIKTFNFLIKQALDKPQFGSLNTRSAIVSLPESKSFVRVIQIPVMSDAEADNAVPFESENFIPLPIDQVYLDWQKIGDAPDGKMNILIIATPKDFVDKYLEALDAANITTVALEVESQSCQRALVGKASHDTVLIVDIDVFRTSLIMVEDGNLQFTSTIPIAGSAFTESIAKSLGVASVKAEEIKRKIGFANTTEYPNIKTALLPVLDSLGAEIKNILKFHGEHSGKQVTKILLAGGAARPANLAEFLAPQFTDFPGLVVERGALVSNVHSPMDAIENLSYITAFGLAMRGAGYDQ